MGSQFKVKVEEEFGLPVLSITHNGYQWTSLRIENPKQEIPAIINELVKYSMEQ